MPGGARQLAARVADARTTQVQNSATRQTRARIDKLRCDDQSKQRRSNVKSGCVKRRAAGPRSGSVPNRCRAAFAPHKAGQATRVCVCTRQSSDQRRGAGAGAGESGRASGRQRARERTRAGESGRERASCTRRRRLDLLAKQGPARRPTRREQAIRRAPRILRALGRSAMHVATQQQHAPDFFAAPRRILQRLNTLGCFALLLGSA